MTKRDFEDIAAIIRGARSSYDDEVEALAIRATDRLADGLAGYFASRNPRFDRARFLAACEVDR